MWSGHRAATPRYRGVLLLLGSPATAFALNGNTFGVSLVTLLPVRARSLATRAEQGGFRSQVSEGLRAVVSSAQVALLSCSCSQERSFTVTNWCCSSSSLRSASVPAQQHDETIVRKFTIRGSRILCQPRAHSPIEEL
jgi:hypothetical protein